MTYKESLNLKPCPFCGSKAELLYMSYGILIRCGSCDARMSKDTSPDYSARDEAINAWNRRVTDEHTD